VHGTRVVQRLAVVHARPSSLEALELLSAFDRFVAYVRGFLL
jgi:hypothetical protein